jgi:hypothetical protein
MPYNSLQAGSVRPWFGKTGRYFFGFGDEILKSERIG